MLRNEATFVVRVLTMVALAGGHVEGAESASQREVIAGGVCLMQDPQRWQQSIPLQPSESHGSDPGLLESSKPASPGSPAPDPAFPDRAKLEPPNAARRGPRPRQSPENKPPVAPSGPPRYNGTAFVVAPDGQFLTAAHVVREAAKVQVLHAGKTYSAKVVAVDAKRDLAYLQISPQGLPTLPLSDMSSTGVGTRVTAFGFPLSASATSTGPRNLGSCAGTITRPATQDLAELEIDSPLNPGFTGGPIVDAHGNVIAVYSAERSDSAPPAATRAVPVNEMIHFLRNHEVPYTPGKNAGTFNSDTLQQRALGALAQVIITPHEPDSGSWAPPTPKLLWQIQVEGGGFCLNGLAVSPDGTLIAVGHKPPGPGEGRQIELRDTRNGELKRSLAGHKNVIYSLAFSHDGKSLASASFDRTAMIWDVENGTLCHVLEGHEGEVKPVAFSSDDTLLLTRTFAGGFTCVRVWDARTSRLKNRINPGFYCSHAAFIPNTHQILIAGQRNTLIAGGSPNAHGIWDCDSGKRVKQPRLSDTDQPSVFSLGLFTFSASGTSIAVWNGQKSFILGYPSLRLRHTLHEHHQLSTLKYSPDGTLLGGAYLQGPLAETIAIYDVPTGALVWQIVGYGKMFSFMSDGKRLVRASKFGIIEMWDISSVAQRAAGRPATVEEAPQPPPVPPRPEELENPAMRTWTDVSGRFSVEAEFMSYGMGTVRLRREDGREISLPIEKLSEPDQEWIRNRKR